MSAQSNNNAKINTFFDQLTGYTRDIFPRIVAETATEVFKESFRTKSFDGQPWQPTKKPVKRGSLMVRRGLLLNSIRPTVVSAERVRISAGNSRVPYARIHNEGGDIRRAARTENFVRNRYKQGAKGKMFGGMGAFKKGTKPGVGLTFKAYTIHIPKRQFMGMTNDLNMRIINRAKNSFMK